MLRKEFHAGTQHSCKLLCCWDQLLTMPKGPASHANQAVKASLLPNHRGTHTRIGKEIRCVYTRLFPSFLATPRNENGEHSETSIEKPHTHCESSQARLGAQPTSTCTNRVTRAGSPSSVACTTCAQHPWPHSIGVVCMLAPASINTHKHQDAR
jgi:hypothetical protein